MALKSKFKKVGKWLGRLLLILCIGIGISMIGCRLAPPQGRTQSVHLSPADTERTTLGKMAAQEQAKHPQLSGLYLLADPREAFAARVKLAKQAEKTLDVQYYIWRDDTTGSLLLETLYEAAERGVRVRFIGDRAHLLARPGMRLAKIDRFASRLLPILLKERVVVLVKVARNVVRDIEQTTFRECRHGEDGNKCKDQGS